MQSSRTPSRRLVTAIAGVQLLALALWAGGLATLGAIVAPIVFRVVPSPTNADAMTLVFHRFDVVAITCAVVALVAEAALAVRGGKVSRVDLARGALLLLAAGLAIGIGGWLSPAITDLHQQGAMRGVGAPGQALDHYHHLAESFAKLELLSLLLAFPLAISKAARTFS